jgi:hypothetical protein
MPIKTTSNTNNSNSIGNQSEQQRKKQATFSMPQDNINNLESNSPPMKIPEFDDSDNQIELDISHQSTSLFDDDEDGDDMTT